MNSKLMEVLFITEDDIKTKTPMSANKVTTSLINFITLSQELYIKKTLGTELYTNLLNEWVNASFVEANLPDGTGTIPPIIPNDTTNYRELYNQIRQPLIWWSYVSSLPYIAVRVTEAGIMLNKTDYSQSAGLVGLDRLVAEGEAVAQSYMKILQEYVCETFKQNELDDAVDVGGPSFGIFVPKRNHHRRYKCKC